MSEVAEQRSVSLQRKCPAYAVETKRNSRRGNLSAYRYFLLHTREKRDGLIGIWHTIGLQCAQEVNKPLKRIHYGRRCNIDAIYLIKLSFSLTRTTNTGNNAVWGIPVGYHDVVSRDIVSKHRG